MTPHDVSGVGLLHASSNLSAGKGRGGHLRPAGEQVKRGLAFSLVGQLHRIVVWEVHMSLLERARWGLRDMPSNASWVVSQLRGSSPTIGAVADEAASKARDQSRRFSEAVMDAVPSGEDSIQLRMKRAEDAAERARDAEERAVAAAQEAKERSDYALDVTQRGRAHVKEVNRNTQRGREQRIQQAEREAEELVRRERLAAEEDAERQRREAYEEVEAETKEAQRGAEEAKERAESLVGQAREAMLEAKRLADEAAEAAHTAAEEAQRRAKELARDAAQQARQAEARVSRAEELHVRSEATARQTATESGHVWINGDLGEYTKSDLIELASSVGIEARSKMPKNELIAAIRAASRESRTRA